MIIETEYPMRLHLTAEVEGDDMGIPDSWSSHELMTFLKDIGHRSSGGNKSVLSERARSLRAQHNSLTHAVSRLQTSQNAIIGLTGEQRVRCEISQFRDNFIPGCWIVSNYSDGVSSHILLVVHDHDIEGELPVNVDAGNVPPIHQALYSMPDFFGLPSYYCIPYARGDEDRPLTGETSGRLDEYLRSRNLPSASKFAKEAAWRKKAITPRPQRLSLVNSRFSKVDYQCVDLGNPAEIMTLQEVLRQNRFPERESYYPQFAIENAVDADALSPDSIREEFWKRHLHWKIHCLAACHTADVDALYLTDEGAILPVEIKSKSMRPANGNNPAYFGIDVSTLAKYLLFSLGEGGGEGIYLVEERDDEDPIRYWATRLTGMYAQMDLVAIPGGRSGFGGRSGTEVMRVPIHAFQEMNHQFFNEL